MHYRTLTVLAIACAVALAANAAPPRPPNILFCIADDASYAHFSANGCAWVKTPAFDRVAREGVRFTRAYTPNAKCAPSRACILTGRNSWQLESAANHGGFYPAGYRTFMEALGAHGYLTGYTGKPWAPGVPGDVDGRPRELCGPAFNELQCDPPTRGISRTDYAANFAAFLKQRAPGQPFCFWYGGHEPHRPYTAGTGAALGGLTPAQVDRVPPYWPDDKIVRDDMLDYAFELEYFDRQLGRILDLLEKSGEMDNTIIVVTSDNGMPFPRAKGASYEISHHMPLAIRWGKQVVQPGRTVDQFVSFIDLAPTFLEVAGLRQEASGMAPITGRSLVSLLRTAVPQPGRDHVLIGQERHDVGRPDDVGYPVRGMFTHGWLYLRNFEPTRWPMCDPITGYLNTDGGPTKTLVLEQNRRGVNHWMWELDFGRRPPEELYDTRTDPDCITNLALEPGRQERRAAMQKELYAELNAQKDPRMEGHGAVFDRYPHGNPAVRDFYNRWLRGERLRAFWAEPTDFEDPHFDPERPLAPR